MLIDTQLQNLILRINVGSSIGALGRVHSRRTQHPQWASYKLYRAGDRVNYGGAVYRCVETHLSVVFDDDSAYWAADASLARDSAATDRAFHVIERWTRQGVLAADGYPTGHLLDAGNEVRIEWRNSGTSRTCFRTKARSRWRTTPTSRHGRSAHVPAARCC